jgi:hypothetical protein
VRKIAISTEGNVVGDINIVAGDDALAMRAGRRYRQARDYFFEHLRHHSHKTSSTSVLQRKGEAILMPALIHRSNQECKAGEGSPRLA